MQRLALIGIVLFSPLVTTATLAAPTQDQCNDAWNLADKDADGDLSGSELTRYLIAIKKDGKYNEAIKDGKLYRGRIHGRLQRWSFRRHGGQAPLTVLMAVAMRFIIDPKKQMRA